jgi:hypothetical protein
LLVVAASPEYVETIVDPNDAAQSDDAAQSAGLRYVSDASAGIRRRMARTGFKYARADGSTISPAADAALVDGGDDTDDAVPRLLPTYAQVGSLAGGGLILMRCLMGLSVGGEYTAVVAYLYESAPFHRRGLVTSLAAAASEIGGLLAVGYCNR